MSATTEPAYSEGLIESCERLPMTKIPLHAARAVGPAAETLAAVLSISKNETFVPQAEIAKRARLPLATVRKHLNKLTPDWLENEGRQATSRGWVRRTTTLRPTKLARAPGEYILLPWWTGCKLNLRSLSRYRATNQLSWSEKMLYGLVVSRMISIKTGVERSTEGGCYVTPDEVFDRDRYRFGLRRLEQTTGMDRKTIIAAKRSLWELRLILWSGDSDGCTTDSIFPNVSLEITTKPAKEPGYIFVEIKPRQREG